MPPADKKSTQREPEVDFQAALTSLKAGLTKLLAEDPGRQHRAKTAAQAEAPGKNEPAADAPARDNAPTIDAAAAELKALAQGLKTILQSVMSNDDELQSAATTEIARLEEKLAELNITLPAELQALPDELRASYHSERQQNREDIAAGMVGLAAALQEAAASVAEVLTEHAGEIQTSQVESQKVSSD